MGKLAKSVSLFAFFLMMGSCVNVDRAAARDQIPPYKAFVKVFRHVSILKCADGNCPKGEWVSTGSGASIDLNIGSEKTSFILTAGHMCFFQETPKNFLKIKTEMVVLDHTGAPHIATILKQKAKDPLSVDLCLLRVSNLNIPKIKISRHGPVPGERVIAMTSPGGIYHPPIVPIFSGIFSGRVNEKYSLITVPSAGGASGGPVLNKKNKIVGVLFAVSTIFNHVSLITDYDSTMKYIDYHKSIIIKKKKDKSKN